MPRQDFWPKRVDRQVEGEAIPVAGHVIRPVARVTGVWAQWAGETGLGGGGWLKIAPVRAVVRDAAGAERAIELSDVNGQAVRRLIATAALVAAAALLVRLVWRRPRGASQ